MKKAYTFLHLRSDRTESRYVDRAPRELRDNEAATHVAIEISKELHADGLSGLVVCEGIWDARGFALNVPLDNISSVIDPYGFLPTDEVLEGYDKVMDAIAILWPWEGGQKTLPQPFHFKTTLGVDVTLSRPRGCLVEMERTGERVEAYHSGPSLQTMMLGLKVSESEARQVWNEVIDKAVALRNVFS